MEFTCFEMDGDNGGLWGGLSESDRFRGSEREVGIDDGDRAAPRDGREGRFAALSITSQRTIEPDLTHLHVAK